MCFAHAHLLPGNLQNLGEELVSCFLLQTEMSTETEGTAQEMDSNLSPEATAEPSNEQSGESQQVIELLISFPSNLIEVPSYDAHGANLHS